MQDLIDYIRASRFSGTNLTVDIEIEGDTHTSIYINKIRITRAMINLIDNALDAIRDREDGKVILRADILKNEVVLTVEDNGCGIPADKEMKIWDIGYSTKNHPGAGLAFVRQVVEGHGGFMNMKSELDQGTKVWITLPSGEGQ